MLHPELVIEHNKRYGDMIKRSKDAWKAGLIRKTAISYEDALVSIGRISEYIEQQFKDERPLTLAGMILASNYGKDTFATFRKGDRDYLAAAFLESHGLSKDDIRYDGDYPYVEVDGVKVPMITISEKFEEFTLMLEAQTEERLYKSGRTGDIFALKAMHGWKDGTNGEPKTINQTLVIADKEQAEKAIKMLK